MADMNKIKRIEGGTLKTVRAQDATIPLNVQTYSGPYTVTPTTEQQTLNTRNRILSANVTVEGVMNDYNGLENKPQVNGVTLQGNKSLEDLGIASAEDVQEKYTKPDSGIPASDIADGVIPDVSGFYTKPASGIPASDIASGVIPDVTGKLDAPSTAGTQGQVLTSDGNGGQTWEDPQGGGGTGDYTDLTNKPQINSVTLTGNKSLSDLSIASASDLAGKQAKITASGILKGDGSGGVTAATAGTDYGTYSKPSGGIPSTDMASAVQTSLGKADTAYQLPSGGMTSSDMASAVQTSLGKADTAYQKPSGGIPSTDMTSAVQTSLGKADSAYQKPSGGIPASDLASGVIPDVSGKPDKAAIADDYDAEETYSTGDHVMHDSYLYVCNNDNVTGTWNSQYWDAESVTERIDGVQTNLTALDAMKATVDGTPSNGDFLVYSSSAGAWVPTTMAAWQGGSY